MTPDQSPSMASQATAELPKLPEPRPIEGAAGRNSVRWGLGYTADQMNAHYLAGVEAGRASRAQSEGTSEPTIAGALFDFMGFLTTHETRWKFSAYDNASPAVEALEEWAAKRGLSLDEANVSGWLTAATLGETK